MPIAGPQRSLFPDDLLTPAFQEEGRGRGLSWWAIYTRSRQEKELMRRLDARGIPFFSPIAPNLYRSPAGRKRISYLPLFTNYVFLFGDEPQRYEAVASGCVSRAIAVPDALEFAGDLRRIQQLLQAGVPVTVESTIEPGAVVRIKSGSMTGLEGTVFKRHGQSRLLVVVNFLQQGASVELADWEVEKL